MEGGVGLGGIKGVGKDIPVVEVSNIEYVVRPSK